MIKNEKQYRITRAWIGKLEDSLCEAKKLPESDKSWLRRGQVESIQVQLDELVSEISEYELLKSGKLRLAPLDPITEVPLLLIKWRIANNWTQKQLATKLGLAEQQIQKYEDNDYATATLETLKRIASALIEGSKPQHAKIIKTKKPVGEKRPPIKQTVRTKRRA